MPFVIWLTGIPSSGKSTIARALKKALKSYGIKVEVLESDQMRKILTPKPKYTAEERDWFYNTLSWLAWLLYKNGINVIIDATGHKAEYRHRAREMIGSDFIEVYVRCPLEVAMSRDTKGLYKLALEGKIKTLPGLQVPYEEPPSPELVVDTSLESLQNIVNKIIKFLKGRGYLR